MYLCVRIYMCLSMCVSPALPSDISALAHLPLTLPSIETEGGKQTNVKRNRRHRDTETETVRERERKRSRKRERSDEQRENTRK